MSEGPPKRLLLIMERHERLQERKRMGRYPPAAALPTHPALAPKPVLALSPLATRDDDPYKRVGHKAGKISASSPNKRPPGPFYDYPGCVKAAQFPISMKEIAQQLGCTYAAVYAWIHKNGERMGIVPVSERITGECRPITLYAFRQPAAPEKP